MKYLPCHFASCVLDLQLWYYSKLKIMTNLVIKFGHCNVGTVFQQNNNNNNMGFRWDVSFCTPSHVELKCLKDWPRANSVKCAI